MLMLDGRRQLVGGQVGQGGEREVDVVAWRYRPGRVGLDTNWEDEKERKNEKYPVFITKILLLFSVKLIIKS
jgi:S-formylglutathione hydrolase FrmB